MAKESCISQPSLTCDDKFEGLEVTEFDPNTLQELLYEPGEEAEVVSADPSLTADAYWCLNDTNDYNAQCLDWLDMIEETSAPSNEMGAWYGGECMEEMNEILDYSLSHSAIMSEDIGYIGLWEEDN